MSELDSSMHGIGQLVREALPDRREPALLAREERQLIAALTRAPRTKLRARTSLLLAAAVLSLAAGVFVATRSHERGATYVVRGTSAGNGYVSAPAAGASVEFSDGSEVVLRGGAAGRIESFETDHAAMVLEHGAAHFRVAHRPSTNWTIRCGPYVVAVKGTEFELSWSPRDGTFQIELQSGLVTVEGGPVGSPFVVAEGQRATIDAEGLKLGRSQGDAPPTVAIDGGALDEGPDAGAEPARPSTSSTVDPGGSAAHGEAKSPRSWAASVRLGRYDEVLSQARAGGLSSILQQASLEDLQALGDAARYRHAPDMAQQVYLTIRQRFPSSGYAKQAAWLLGRLSEANAPEEAITWFQRYRLESPGGPYSTDSLGREMLVCARLGRTARATELADRYLHDAPTGPFAGSAKKISSHP